MKPPEHETNRGIPKLRQRLPPSLPIARRHADKRPQSASATTVVRATARITDTKTAATTRVASNEMIHIPRVRCNREESFLATIVPLQIQFRAAHLDN